MENQSSQGPSDSFEVFFDGGCPLCAKEIDFIRWLDKKNVLIFTDIDADEFNPEQETGLDFETLMASIHGRLADGTIIHGVEVFRQLYGRTSLNGSFGHPSSGITQLLDVIYDCFARHHLPLTGRYPPELYRKRTERALTPSNLNICD